MKRLLTVFCALFVALAFSRSAAAAAPTRAPQLGTDTRPRKPDQPRPKAGGTGTSQQQGSSDEEKGSGDYGRKVEKKDEGTNHDKK